MATHGNALHLQRTDTDLLQSLADRAELTDLVHRLTAALDEHRFDDLRALLIEDSTAQTPGGLAQGREAVIAQATRNHQVYDRLQHLLSGVLVDLDGDRAEIRANLVGVFGNAPADQPARAIGAVYRFETVRTRDGWRIASVDVRLVWRQGEAPIPVPA